MGFSPIRGWNPERSAAVLIYSMQGYPGGLYGGQTSLSEWDGDIKGVSCPACFCSLSSASASVLVLLVSVNM